MWGPTPRLWTQCEGLLFTPLCSTPASEVVCYGVKVTFLTSPRPLNGGGGVAPERRTHTGTSLEKVISERKETLCGGREARFPPKRIGVSATALLSRPKGNPSREMGRV